MLLPAPLLLLDVTRKVLERLRRNKTQKGKLRRSGVETMQWKRSLVAGLEGIWEMGTQSQVAAEVFFNLRQ